MSNEAVRGIIRGAAPPSTGIVRMSHISCITFADGVRRYCRLFPVLTTVICIQRNLVSTVCTCTTYNQPWYREEKEYCIKYIISGSKTSKY